LPTSWQVRSFVVGVGSIRFVVRAVADFKNNDASNDASSVSPSHVYRVKNEPTEPILDTDDVSVKVTGGTIEVSYWRPGCEPVHDRTVAHRPMPFY
jgi:hypothetical protein